LGDRPTCCDQVKGTATELVMALDLARSQGAYAVMQQGRQPDGAARKPKLKINFAAAMKP